MTRWVFCGGLVLAGASLMAAPAPRRASPGPAPSQAFRPPQTFQKYCFECHGGSKHKGDVSIERLIRLSAESSVGEYWDDWNKVAEMLESGDMPPQDKADLFPTDDERTAATTWIRSV